MVPQIIHNTNWGGTTLIILADWTQRRQEETGFLSAIGAISACSTHRANRVRDVWKLFFAEGTLIILISI